MAFLDAPASRKIAVIPPKGLVESGCCWFLQKAMFGVREASKCWGNIVIDTRRVDGTTDAVDMSAVGRGYLPRSALRPSGTRTQASPLCGAVQAFRCDTLLTSACWMRANPLVETRLH